MQKLVPARAQDVGVSREIFDIFISVCIIIIAIQALMPINVETLYIFYSKCTQTKASTKIIKALGKTNNVPLIKPPCTPNKRKPRYVASCIAFGPGSNV